MAYDEALVGRIRAAVSRRSNVDEKKMFGGVAFLLDGKMFCGVVKDELMVRVGPAAFERALRRPHVRPMDFTGRPMKGYVFVGAAGCRQLRAVADWAEAGLSFVKTIAKGKKKEPAAPKAAAKTARNRAPRRGGRA